VKKLYLIIMVMFISTYVYAGAVNVEIFYLPHRPAESVVEKIEQTLAGSNFVKIKKYSFDDNSSEALIKKYNLVSHMPVAIFINGTDTYSIEGKEVVFRNFPKGDSFVPNFEGGWSYEDLKKVVIKVNRTK